MFEDTVLVIWLSLAEVVDTIHERHLPHLDLLIE